MFTHNDLVDYEAEVKKIYPDYECVKWERHYGYRIFNGTKFWATYVSIGDTALDAWRNAYLSLKKQEKL